MEYNWIPLINLSSGKMELDCIWIFYNIVRGKWEEKVKHKREIKFNWVILINHASLELRNWPAYENSSNHTG